MSEMKIQYQEAELSAVLQHFVDGFAPRDGALIDGHEAFVDVAKGRVLFRLYIRGPEVES